MRHQKGPGDPLAPLRERMDNLFEEWMSVFGPPPSTRTLFERPLFSPRVDVTQDPEIVRIVAELPGLDEKDVKVQLTQDSLVIEGEKKEEKEECKEERHWKERRFGSFHRVIPLPCEVDREKVEAKFNKGVLTVTLTKAQEARENIRQIPIEPD